MTKKNRHRKASRNPQPTIMMDYTSRILVLLQKEVWRTLTLDKPHPIREQFWSLLPRNEYDGIEARILLGQYLSIIEASMAKIICQYSIAYWLHLTRRILPGSPGSNQKPITVGIVRAILDASIQKYGRTEPCSHLALSTEVTIKDILGGMLLGKEFQPEREALEKQPQLVLVDFEINEIKLFYELEKLAYEIWFASAGLRIVGKGAGLDIIGPPHWVTDNRTDELDYLVKSYDDRIHNGHSYTISRTGTVVSDYNEPRIRHGIILPYLNISAQGFETHNEFFKKAFKVDFSNAPNFIANFLWNIFNLYGYYQSHKPFSKAFSKRYGVTFESIIAVLIGLNRELIYRWIESKGNAALRSYQRAYEGPFNREIILERIKAFLPDSYEEIGIGRPPEIKEEIPEAMEFLDLKSLRPKPATLTIELNYPGPHSVFLPYGDNVVFIDYAWISRRLYDLFIDVSIPDQNFKGVALEQLIGTKTPILTTGPCIAINGEKKQIDAAYAVNNRLIIVECKVMGERISFDRGDPYSLKVRAEFIDRILDEVDDKARWLAANPVGSNYDISAFRSILPVGVSAFVEYIHSINPRYWLTERLPRVMTPDELHESLEKGTLSTVISPSIVTISGVQ